MVIEKKEMQGNVEFYKTPTHLKIGYYSISNAWKEQRNRGFRKA